MDVNIIMINKILIGHLSGDDGPQGLGPSLASPNSILVLEPTLQMPDNDQDTACCGETSLYVWLPAWFLNSAFPQIPQCWSPPVSSSLCHLCKSGNHRQYNISSGTTDSASQLDCPRFLPVCPVRCKAVLSCVRTYTPQRGQGSCPCRAMLYLSHPWEPWKDHSDRNHSGNWDQIY